MLVLALCTLAAFGDSYIDVPADEPGPESEDLHYRRVLVPQERIADHTRGFLPMERATFQQLLSANPVPAPVLGGRCGLDSSRPSTRLFLPKAS